MTQKTKTHRAQDALARIAQAYPGAWETAETFRADKGDPDFDWPDWCYLPLAGAYAIVSGGGRIGLDRAADVSRLGAMIAWRMTQGIYRFDPAVYDAVRDTPVTGDIPADALMHMPEWCIYVETPDMQASDHALHGFFAHLEHDMNDGRTELRLLLDTDGGLVPVPVHLGVWSLSESLNKMLAEAQKHAPAGIDPGAHGVLRSRAEPLISMLLYICSSTDFSKAGKEAAPANPKPTKTKKGLKTFAAKSPAVWDVGLRMGAALRRAYHREQTGSDPAPDGRSVRPHVRRAHWHTFVSGPTKRDGVDIPATERKRDLRWVPPIAVNADDGSELPAVIRKVS